MSSNIAKKAAMEARPTHGINTANQSTHSGLNLNFMPTILPRMKKLAEWPF
jgi:hypothetical protein